MKLVHNSFLGVVFFFSILLVAVLFYYLAPGFEGTFVERVNQSPFTILSSWIAAGVWIVVSLIIQRK